MVYDIYSKRSTRTSGDGGDIYQYSSLPYQVRVQLVHLWGRFLKKDEKVFSRICRELQEEYGCFSLLNLVTVQPSNPSVTNTSWSELVHFFLFAKQIEQCLDVIEACARAFCNQDLRADNVELLGEWGADIVARLAEEKDQFKSTLNSRLREAQFGYQFENNQIIRIDDQFLHREVMKPALYLISSKGFEGANQEFLEAHQKYRDSDYKGSLIESAKAFESVLKIVLMQRGQVISDKENFINLLQRFFALNLMPAYLQDQFSALKAVLQGGVPKVRNREAAHGQGEGVREVPEYLAAYGLHQTASAILLIIKTHQTAQ